MRRFFLENIKEGSKHVELDGDEFRHLKTVLRLGAGDRVVILDGKGFEHEGTIDSIGRGFARIELAEARKSKGESPLDITLLQGYAKGNKPELIVEKATELGVKQIIFYSGKTSVPEVKDADKKLLRFKKTSIAALKQCERGVLPSIGFMEFQCAIKSFKDGFLKLMLYEEERENSIKDAIRGYHKGMGVIVIVGPEGGFSTGETMDAKKQGFLPVTLGHRRLRVETASIAVISILQHELGDMG